MSSFLHEMEEACSHSLKKPSDKSHKADHNCGKSHFKHNSFQIFTSDLQRELSCLGCVAELCQSSRCWHGSDSLAHSPRSAKLEELLLKERKWDCFVASRGHGLFSGSSLPLMLWVSSCSASGHTGTRWPSLLSWNFPCTENLSVLCFLHFSGLKWP